ncbi:MAG: polysaccharide biosynthesis/export family protein [Phycisphaerales bacterium]
MGHVAERARTAPRRIIQTVLVAAIGFVSVGCNQVAPTVEPAAGMTAPRDGVGVDGGVLPDRLPYTLAEGDQISIKMYDDEKLDLDVRLDSDGGFQYPYLNRVRATGLTTSDLAKKIRMGLEPYYVEPNVTVNLVSQEQQYVNVLGEVARPGRIELDRGMRITDALAMAGDLTRTGSRERVVLIRRVAEEEIAAGFFNYKEALHNPLSDAFASNILLQRGDMIFVPRSDRAQWESAFQFISTIVDPIVDVERAIVLYPDVRDVLETGEKDRGSTIIVR